MAAIIPLVRQKKLNEPLIELDLSLIDYHTDRGEYEPTADVSFNRAETWVNSLYVRIDPNYVAAGDLRVIVWDTVSTIENGNPSAPATTAPSVRTIDSNDLAPGDLWFFEPPTNFVRVIPSTKVPGAFLQINFGYHLEYGYRVQVIDTSTGDPIVNAARITTTYIGKLSHP